MLEGNNAARYYLSAGSNFIAAFGGGMILGKGIGAITATFIQGGSILAFFLGTVLGLFFLQFVPEKWSKIIACFFSFCGALTSFFLLGVFNYYSVSGKISGMAALFFFLLLCIRFGFWFYSRVFRASEVAGQQQRIAWVEFGYYAGMILGLIIWEFLGINLGLCMALIVDIFLQFTAGLIDIITNKRHKSHTSNLVIRLEDFKVNGHKVEISALKNLINYNKYNEKIWGWRLAGAVVFLTVGTQVVTFSLAHQVSQRFGSYILAFFYMGVSMAAIMCSQFKIRLDWNHHKDKNPGHAMICYHIMENEQRISFFLISLISLVGVLMAVLVTISWRWDMLIIRSHDLLLRVLDNRGVLLLLFVCLSAFFYEVLALAILDRIGFEEKFSNYKGMVVRAYGLMGVGAAISLWIIGATKSSLFGLIFIVGICSMVAILSIWRRSPKFQTL